MVLCAVLASKGLATRLMIIKKKIDTIGLDVFSVSHHQCIYRSFIRQSTHCLAKYLIFYLRGLNAPPPNLLTAHITRLHTQSVSHV